MTFTHHLRSSSSKRRLANWHPTHHSHFVVHRHDDKKARQYECLAILFFTALGGTPLEALRKGVVSTSLIVIFDVRAGWQGSDVFIRPLVNRVHQHKCIHAML
ncbi:hypothetical protein Plim_0867 [Planctopirus limnophila DSM 3776]|uniref:Uncharacterized protein n=1 Tax=Planctopirus limnophila (strain ATCC 43296 / DSM 3776 / IFAM 1008 / Mu 290) TaxID=521674 RepID=D5SSG3_PLAL2|nr:hypothetical protein Plim_0867 [Planctopirus limnophila DSM 3776]